MAGNLPRSAPFKTENSIENRLLGGGECTALPGAKDIESISRKKTDECRKDCSEASGGCFATRQKRKKRQPWVSLEKKTGLRNHKGGEEELALDEWLERTYRKGWGNCPGMTSGPSRGASLTFKNATDQSDMML